MKKLFGRISSAITAAVILSCTATGTVFADTSESTGPSIQSEATEFVYNTIASDILSYTQLAAKTEEDLLDANNGDIRELDAVAVADNAYDLDGTWDTYAGPINYTTRWGDDVWTLTYYAAQQNGLQHTSASYDLWLQGTDFHTYIDVDERAEQFSIATEYNGGAEHYVLDFASCTQPQSKQSSMYLTLSDSNGFVYSTADIAMLGVIDSCVGQLSDMLFTANAEEETPDDELLIGTPIAWSDEPEDISNNIANYLNDNLANNSHKLRNAYAQALNRGVDVRNQDIGTVLQEGNFLPYSLNGIRCDDTVTYFDLGEYVIAFEESIQDDFGVSRGGRIKLLKGAYGEGSYQATINTSNVENTYTVSTFTSFGRYDAIGYSNSFPVNIDEQYFTVHGITDNGIADINQISIIATLLQYVQQIEEA